MADRAQAATLAGIALPLVWDLAVARYRDAAGVLVPEAVVRQALEAVIADSRARLAILAERFGAGDLDALAFRVAAREELRVAYGLAAALAHGGADQMTGTAWGTLGAQLRRAYGFLDQLALQVVTGEVSVAQLTARAQMYAGGAWQVYQAAQGFVAVQAGHTEERSVLDGGEHCAACEAEAARGWVPLGMLVPIGERTCLTNCRCERETRPAAPAALEAAGWRDWEIKWNPHQPRGPDGRWIGGGGSESGGSGTQQVHIRSEAGLRADQARTRRALERLTERRMGAFREIGRRASAGDDAGSAAAERTFNALGEQQRYYQGRFVALSDALRVRRGGLAPDARATAEYRAVAEAFGEHLHVTGDAAHPGLQRDLQHLRDLPPRIATRLREAGLRGVHLGTADLPHLDDLGDLHNEQPRGWTPGATWDSVGGVYDGTRHVAAVASLGRSGSRATVLHELGHAMGDLFRMPVGTGALGERRIDDHPDLVAAHQRLFHKLSPYEQQAGPGGRPGRQEFWAESVAHYFTSPPREFEQQYDGEYRQLLRRWLGASHKTSEWEYASSSPGRGAAGLDWG